VIAQLAHRLVMTAQTVHQVAEAAEPDLAIKTQVLNATRLNAPTALPAPQLAMMALTALRAEAGVLAVEEVGVAVPAGQ
jgi:hypothetical protein